MKRLILFAVSIVFPCWGQTPVGGVASRNECKELGFGSKKLSAILLSVVRLHIRVDGLPTDWEPYGAIYLQLQTKKGFELAEDGVYVVPMERKPNRKGEIHWTGDGIHFHGDGRRFIYLSWVSARGERFRRIKLYLDLIPELESGNEDVFVTIAGTMKDGTPACSTARVI